ncbi:unnamed protein product [Rotaria sp. Silwood2]|nr:unnamed protein product [Rotaria sp. Silwood2]CAF2860064.1 unnamed protein product [Rotaria sp. Silwood2]CAF3224692.1 unnamed protein product [Rotaria sp. Silwood2]CAF4408695.1 unnamed protein product [Rotaria sp. Silwood2]CAF4494527.1 unnamed protein product [Rotaria sp. Silwood2]
MDDKKKRKVTFHEITEEHKKQKNTTNDTRLHSGKYTLDSDEDDDDEQGNVKQMNQNDLDEIGQESATIGFDNDVKITPFNIDEELEEGHYDETGCFQWKKKDKEEVHDAWLDEIDWTNVKNYKLKNPDATGEDFDDQKQSHLSNDDDDDNDNDDTDKNQFNEINTLQSMLTIMEPGETVARTIKRLGTVISNNKPKQQWKQRKPLPGEIQTVKTVEQTPEELKKNKLLLEEMSGLADQFVSNGELDIYQETYERLKTKLDRLQSSNSSKTTTDSAFNMYGDSDVSSSVNKSTSSKNINTSSSEVLWEYTTDGNSTENLQGPFTTEQMVRLINTEGKLDKNKVLCRRIGTEQFYSIKRIDFDLYLD